MEAWKKLFDHLPSLSPESVFEALRLIDTPPDLMGFYHVAQRASAILLNARLFAELYEGKDSKRVQQTLNSLIARGDTLTELTAQLELLPAEARANLKVDFPWLFFSPRDIDIAGWGRKSLRPHTNTHPLYCAIWYGCGSSTYREQHHVLIAFSLFTLQLMPETEMKSKRADLGRCLRKLGEPNSARLLEPVPKTPCDIETLFTKLVGTVSEYSQLASSTDEPLQFFTRRALEAWNFFTPAQRLSKRQRHTGGGGKMVGIPDYGQVTNEHVVTDTFEIKDDLIAHEILQCHDRTIAGDAANEFGVNTVTLSLAPKKPEDNSTRKDVLRMRLRTKGLHNALARQRQNLPFSLNQPTPTEIRHLLELLWDEKKVGPQKDPSILLIWLILISGHSFEELRKTQLNSRVNTTAVLTQPRLRKRHSNWEILVPTYSTQRLDLLTKEQQKNYHPVDNQLALPLPEWLGQALSELSSSGSGKTIFHGASKILLQDIDYTLKRINSKTEFKWSLARIETLLFSRLQQMPGGDSTIASLVTGQQRELYLVPLSYTGISPDFIVKRYQEAWHSLVTSDGATPPWPHYPPARELRLDANPDDCLSILGSRLRPWHAPLKACISELQCVINEGLSQYKLQDIHNTYTIYTLLLLGLATGARPTLEAFARESDLDLELGWCTLSDKDNDQYFHTRVIYLAHPVRLHMKAYLEYRRRLFIRLATYNLSALQQTQAQITNKQQKTGYKREPRAAKRSETGADSNNLNNHVGTHPPLFFFLNRDHSRQPVSHNNYQDYLSYFINIRPNSNRHLLRSLLSEDGCGQTILAAFMGHHRHGEAPWERYSSLSPRLFAQAMDRRIIKLMEDLGLRALVCPIL